MGSSGPFSPPSDAEINRVLAEIHPTLRGQHRVALQDGDTIAIPSNHATLLYVISGKIRASSAVHHTPKVGLPATLSEGDAALFSGIVAGSYIADHHAFALVTSLDYSGLSNSVRDRLPKVLLVSDLPGNEPAVAAFAAQIGPEVAAGLRPAQDSTPSVHCQMMANTVLFSVIHTWAARGCAPEGWPSRTNDPHLDRVLDAIDANPGGEWSIEDLARVGAMSRSAFSERFRTALGTSPGKYVGEARIRSAQSLLARGMGVSEVSRAIGYGSDEGFSRAFQRSVGITPSAWRSEALQHARG